MQSKKITIYHSPDSDDAFMFFGLTSGAVRIPGYDFTHELCDIETLNQRTKKGELDVTAVSVHAYAHLNNQYVILRSGASMGGEDYGPCLVVKAAFDLKDGKKRKIALPGALTSANLATRIYLAENGIEADIVNIPFMEVEAAVRAGEVDGGVIIHEGQLTHERLGLKSILNLGSWWWQKTGLPLPLGVNVVRKALGAGAIEATATVLRQSIEYGMSHRDKALDYALSYGRGISKKDADIFVGMYVNDWTIDLGEKGMSSIRLFLETGLKYKLIPEAVRVEFA